jgi:D-amino-acid dehydrogenase
MSSSNGSGQGRVAVIGAGIIGACCASYLARAGRAVTLIDRLPPGEACSFGNAGSLASAACVPNAMPGMLRSVPGWLLDRDGPLTVRWRYLPRLAPWLLAFVRAGNDWKRVKASADALRSLHAPTLESYQTLAREAGAPELVRASDQLYIYGSEASYRKSLPEWDLRSERGVALEHLDGAALRELEPALAPRYVRAVRILEQGFCLNPSRLVKVLVDRVLADGGELVQGEVSGFASDGTRVSAVRLGDRSVACDAVVVAAGAWSTRLTETLGLRLPLEAERGYHATLPDPRVQVTRPIMEADRKFIATPMEMGLRLAGTVELAGVDAAPDYGRAETILRLGRKMFPGLETAGASQWMGCRPSLPDGLPVIGPAPRHDNVFLAFGHGHTGLIGGAMTGRVISGLVTGARPNIDITPFRADRF